MMTNPDSRPTPGATGTSCTNPTLLPAEQTLDISDGNPPSETSSDMPVTEANLARISIRRAIEDARNKPKSKPKRRPAGRRITRTDGREPNLLGGVISQLVVDNQWQNGKEGGDLKNKWASLISKKQAAHWKADRFDETTGTLYVLCDSPNWATSLRLTERKVIADVNEKFSGNPLKRLDVRVPSSGVYSPARQVASEEPATTAPPPVLRKERGTAPNAEYREQRAEEAKARAARLAAGEAACPPRSAPTRPVLRKDHGVDPNTEFLEQRAQMREKRIGSRDQAHAVPRHEQDQSSE